MAEGISHYGFDHGIRDTLRYSHGFDAHANDRAERLFNHALENLKGVSSSDPHLTASHFKEAERIIEKHPEWQHFSHSEQQAFKSVLESHLGIHNPGQ